MAYPARTSSTMLCNCVSRSLRQSAASSKLPATSSSHRAIHSRPNLPYDIRNGVEPFLSAKALRGTAVEWHQGCLDRLNDLTRGTQYENQSVANTVIGSSKARQDALIFGHASEALNNGFFLSSLKPPSSSSAPSSNQPPVVIEDALSSSFGSPTSFINYFSSYANGMFGTGYVWLVMDAVDNLAVLSTYGSGTVLVQGNQVRAPELEPFVAAEEEESGPSAGSSDAATLAAQEAIGHETERESRREYENDATSSNTTTPSSFTQFQSQQTRSYHSTPVRSMQPSPSSSIDFKGFPNQAPKAGPAETSAMRNYLENMGKSPTASMFPRRKEPQRFISIHPLLCLSLHPHVYIPDYGIWGKEKYIQNFWKNVDWQRVLERYDTVKSIYNDSSSIGRQGRYNVFRGRPAQEAFNAALPGARGL